LVDSLVTRSVCEVDHITSSESIESTSKDTIAKFPIQEVSTLVGAVNLVLVGIDLEAWKFWWRRHLSLSDLECRQRLGTCLRLHSTFLKWC